MGRSGSGLGLTRALPASASQPQQGWGTDTTIDRSNSWQKDEQARGGCCGGRASGPCCGKADARALPAGQAVKALTLALPVANRDQQASRGGSCCGKRACGADAVAAPTGGMVDVGEGALERQAAAPCCGTRRRRDELDGCAAGADAEGLGDDKAGSGGCCGASMESGQTLQAGLSLKVNVDTAADSCKRSKTGPASPRLHKVSLHTLHLLVLEASHICAAC